MKKTIYLISHGTMLRKVGRRLLLEQKNDRIFEIPCKDVARILIYGRTEIPSQTLTTLLEMAIPVYLLRRSGRSIGKLAPTTDAHVAIRRQQYQKMDDPQFTLPLSRALIHYKIANMQAVVQHIKRNEKGTAKLCTPFKKAQQQLSHCNSREEIMGVEGAATRHYFQIYGSSLPEPFQFTTRSRRPAADATNALLNLGYMVLLREIEAHLEAHHLDPYLGMLHAVKEGRPSLALDLLEEFRQPLVDLFILKTLQRQQLAPEHFDEKDGAIEIKPDGFHKFFRLYEQQMGTQDGDQPGLRKLLDDQVTSLKQCLDGKAEYNHFVLSAELCEEQERRSMEN